MVAWLDWIERTNPDGTRSEELGNNYGDWLCIPADTTFRTHSEMKTLLATAYWADDARKMAEMAAVLNKPEAESRFTEIVPPRPPTLPTKNGCWKTAGLPSKRKPPTCWRWRSTCSPPKPGRAPHATWWTSSARTTGASARALSESAT